MERKKFICITVVLAGLMWILTKHLVLVSREHDVEWTKFYNLDTRDNELKFDVCVVGAGLSGAVIAERYAATTNKSILVLEKRNHIGGNCYDYIDTETGIRVSKYGAHLFHTKYDMVWNYIKRFSEWVPYQLKVQALVQGKHVPVPVNINTVNILFNLSIKSVQEMDKWLEREQVYFDHDPANSEEKALSRVGKRLYELMFKPYTIKQWNKKPADLDPSVLARIPVRNNWEDRYFTDKYQALPKQGYTAIFKNMLKSPKITVLLNTDYFDVRENIKCDKTFFTGPIDRYYEKKGLPALEYRSLSFERKVIRNISHFQPASIVNHPDPSDDYTRVVEYKWLPHQQYDSNDTVIFIERSTDIGEPYYPVPNKRNHDLYNLYKSFAQLDHSIHFLGRLANYKYFNMDEAVKNALEMFEQSK